MNSFESSFDYGTNTILVMFDGEFSESQLLAYLAKYHPIGGPGVYQLSEVSHPTKFRGFKNPGSVNVTINEFTFTHEPTKS